MEICIGRAHGGNKGAHFAGILDAFGAFDARADVNRQRLAARPQQAHAIAHICRRQPTTQDEVSVDVCWNE